jgi:hypothetical protein
VNGREEGQGQPGSPGEDDRERELCAMNFMGHKDYMLSAVWDARSAVVKFILHTKIRFFCLGLGLEC